MYLPDNDNTALSGGRLWCFFCAVRTLNKNFKKTKILIINVLYIQ
jgi:hypothetical protein